MNDKPTREACIKLLVSKREELKNAGEVRLPKRSDFSDTEVMYIKSFFGPWPRALEAAGLKEPRGEDRKLLNVQKRARAKRRRREAEKERKKQT